MSLQHPNPETRNKNTDLVAAQNPFWYKLKSEMRVFVSDSAPFFVHFYTQVDRYFQSKIIVKRPEFLY
jgi:hypothetical protein